MLKNSRWEDVGEMLFFWKKCALKSRSERLQSRHISVSELSSFRWVATADGIQE